MQIFPSLQLSLVLVMNSVLKIGLGFVERVELNVDDFYENLHLVSAQYIVSESQFLSILHLAFYLWKPVLLSPKQ